MAKAPTQAAVRAAAKSVVDTFDYSDFKDGPGDNLLAQIGATAQEQKRAEAEVARLEEALTKAKENLRDIAERRLPELMDAAEAADFTTKDGLKVVIAETIRGSIPKANEARAFKWLEDHDHPHLIKRQFTIEFGKDQEAWAKKFEGDLAKRKKPLNVKRKNSVHPATLQSFIREQLEKGVDIPLDVFGAFRQRVAKVIVKDKD